MASLMCFPKSRTATLDLAPYAATNFVAPVIAPNGLAGNPITGFPGFGGISAYQTLAYVAAMLEDGVPVVYSYTSDAHDKHSFPSRAYGPGELGYAPAARRLRRCLQQVLYAACQ